MGVITISRGSYSKGKEIAEKLAANLKYECFSRDALLEASSQFNIPELKLVRAIHNAPSFLEQFGHRKEKYINYIREAFLAHIKEDNIVYHGLAGHFFIRKIPTMLKVRIVANIEDRVKEEMKRENISKEVASRLLTKDDDERRKWSMNLYGIDTNDPSLYDVVLHIDSLQVDDAVEILSDISKRPCFQTTDKARAMMNDSYLAAKAHSIIYGKIPAAEVKCENSIVYVNIETILSLEEEFTNKAINLLKEVEGIKEVRVNIIPFESE